MAEQLVNEFTVNRPIDEAWAVITDVERIAPCLPGAQLQEIEGDVYRGIVKIKLGSIAPQFKGQASFIERDDAGHRAVLKAEGRDTGGRGNASAEIEAHAESLSPTSTRVDRHDGPAHHRQGRPVRAGDHRRRLQEADGPVRRQPQHDARRAAGRGDAASAAPARGRRRGRRPVRRPCPTRPSPTRRRRERARRRHAPPRDAAAVRRGAAHPQDRQPGQRARRPRRRRRPGHAQARRARSSSGSCCCCSSCAAGAEGAGPG